MIDQLREAVGSFGLAGGAGVRSGRTVVEAEPVAGSGPGTFVYEMPPSVRAPQHCTFATVRHQGDGPAPRSPNGEVVHV